MNKPVPETLLRPRATGEAGRALAHESAPLHVAGAAPYTDDIPEPAGTLHAALGLSPLAHGTIEALDLAPLRCLPGVVDVFAAEAIPGTNDCGPLVHDDPILAGGPGDSLRYRGQPVFVVVAEDRDSARRAAARVSDVLKAHELPPLLGAREAHAAGRYVVPAMHLVRGDPTAALAAAPHRLKTTLSVGGQEQFYLEGQISLAVPQEAGGMLVHCSTQHPSEMQHLVAHALGVAAHAVQVSCRRMGGGFGGKESQSAQFACIAAVAAQRLGRAVKLRLDRDDDFLVTGRRHDFEIYAEVGFDDQGRLLAVEADLISRAGHSADLSGPVMTRALCHLDNAYWLPHVAGRGYSAKTNTQSNTAFRGFGGPQGAIAIEAVIDDVARTLGLDALDVRMLNLYGEHDRNVTPYGQPLGDNLLHRLLPELRGWARYDERRRDIAGFNAGSPVLKKGLAITPVKFGISFNVVHLNQAGALVHVYTDGSVLVNHGGTEMGQGLNTKVAQVVAGVFGLPLARVRCSAADTHKIANTSATAASTGSDLNGKAAEDAALKIRDRLAAFLAARHRVDASGIAFTEGAAHFAGQALAFAELVQQAYLARVQLWSDGFYATPGLSWDKATMQGRPFFYFAYGAACSEVIVDTLTGEWKLLAAHLLHDAGRSLNPAIDIGQIEGGFIQGMGWLTLEELVWHPRTGLLLTHSPSTYKIPTANDTPAVFETRLFEVENGVGCEVDTVHRSKAVGEPPLLLAFSVFFAIRDAISAADGHRMNPPLTAPATPEAILRAVTALSARDAD
jgi:xanthine dehydrogenase large subunit